MLPEQKAVLVSEVRAMGDDQLVRALAVGEIIVETGKANDAMIERFALMDCEFERRVEERLTTA